MKSSSFFFFFVFFLIIVVIFLVQKKLILIQACTFNRLPFYNGEMGLGIELQTTHSRLWDRSV